MVKDVMTAAYKFMKQKGDIVERNRSKRNLTVKGFASKTLSLFLCLCLVITMIPGEAFADVSKTTANESQEGEIFAEEKELGEGVLEITFANPKGEAKDGSDRFDILDYQGKPFEYGKLKAYAKRGEAGLYQDAQCIKRVEKIWVFSSLIEQCGEPVMAWHVEGGKIEGTYTSEQLLQEVVWPSEGWYRVEIKGTLTGFYKEETDVLGNKSSAQYDSRGNATQITNALGHTVAASYTSLGSLALETTAEGYTTRYEYEPIKNKKGKVIGERLTKKLYHDGTYEEYVYDQKEGDLIWHRNVDGTLEKYTYGETYAKEKQLIQTTIWEDKEGLWPKNRESLQEKDALRIIKKEYKRIEKSHDDMADWAEGGKYGRGESIAAYQNQSKKASSEDTMLVEDWETEIQQVPGGTVSLSTTKIVRYRMPETWHQYWVADRDTDEDKEKIEASKVNWNETTLIDAQGKWVTTTTKDKQVVKIETEEEERVLTYDKDEHLLQVDVTYKQSRQTETEVRYQYKTYEEGDLIVTQIDGEGNKTTSFYDKDEKLLSYTDGNGHTTQYVYDAKGQITEIISPLGNVTKYRYDAVGQLCAIIDGEGGVTLFTYDGDGRKIKESIKESETAQTVLEEYEYEYDAKNRLIQKKSGAAILARYTYDAAGNVLTYTDGNRNTTKYTYDVFGNLLSEETPEGVTYVNFYNYQSPQSNERVGYAEVYPYDSSGNRIPLEEAEGFDDQAQFWYENGNVVKVKDREGNITTFTYDEHNRQRSATVETKAGDQVTKEVTLFSYDRHGNLTTVIEPDGATTSNKYDKNGNLKKTIDPMGYVELREYDGNGNVTKVSQGYFKEDGDLEPEIISETRYAYDAENRCIREEEIPGAVTEYEYDKAGRLTAVKTTVDGEEIIQKTTYDKAGRVLSEENPLAEEGSNEHKIRYEYDRMGRVTKQIGEDGKRFVTYRYDGNGNVIEQSTKINGLMSTYEYAYNRNNQLTRVTDPEGWETTYSYNVLGLLETETDAENGTTCYAYDKNGNVVSITNPAKHRISYEYDSHGRIIKETDARKNSYRYEYDQAGNLIKVIYPDGGEESYRYDFNHRLLGYKDSEGYMTSYAYTYEYDEAVGDVVGKTTVKDGNGNVTVSIYDRQGRLIRTRVNTARKDEAGEQIVEETIYRYDVLGRVKEIVDADGGISGYVYDKKGRVIESFDAAGHTTSLVYDALDRVVMEKNWNRYEQEEPVSRKYGYDDMGNVVAYRDGLGQEFTYRYTYDKNGNCISYVDETGVQTKYQYDKLNRLIGQSNSLGQQARYFYDAAGNRHITVLNGVATSYTYDENGNVLTQSGACGAESKITYDAMNRPAEVGYYRVEEENPAAGVWQTTKYTYDHRGFVTVQTNQDKTQKKYEYDGNGNVIKEINEENQVTRFGYDEKNNLISITYGNSEKPAVIYRYDATGALVQMEDRTGITKFEVDALDRITKVTDSNGKVVSYGYDALGNQAWITYPDESQVTYRYDMEGRLEEVKSSADGSTFYAYSPRGYVTDKILPNRERVSYTYDDFDRIKTMEEYTPAGTLRYRTTYEYDVNGNRTNTQKQVYVNGVEDPKAKEVKTYGYDHQNRMITSTDGVVGDGILTVGYTYDSVGNLIKESRFKEGKSSGEVINYRYNVMNQLTQKEIYETTAEGLVEEAKLKEVVSYAYDKRGGRIRQEGKEGIYHYYYDEAGRLQQVSMPTGEQSVYEYNGLGIRTGYHTVQGGRAGERAGGTKDYNYVIDYTSPENDELAVYACVNGKGEYIRRNIYAGSEKLAQITNGTLPGLEPVLYIHEDIMGTTDYFTRSDGSVYASIDMDVWGMPKLTAEQVRDENLEVVYTGHPYDKLGQLYYAEARFYDPKTRSFLSEDPEKDGSNWYQYCASNPATYWDPTGLYYIGSPDDILNLDEEDRIELQEEVQWLKENPEMIEEIMVSAGVMFVTMLAAPYLGGVAMLLVNGGLGALENGIDYYIEHHVSGEPLDGDGLRKAMEKGAIEGAFMGMGGSATIRMSEAAKVLKPLESCAQKAERIAKQTTKRWANTSREEIMDGIKRWSVRTGGNFLGGVGVDYAEGLVEGKSGEESFRDALARSGEILLEAAFMSAVDTVVEAAAPRCFVAGTLVLTAEGSVAIEEIKAGDMVLAFDEETGEIAYKEVLQTFENTIDELTHVTVRVAEEETTETIHTTPGHPFYVEAEGAFVDACELTAGTELTLADGRKAIVEKVVTEELTEPVKVYNFEVADFHTYYVGENSVLVHNMECERETGNEKSAKESVVRQWSRENELEPDSNKHICLALGMWVLPTSKSETKKQMKPESFLEGIAKQPELLRFAEMFKAKTFKDFGHPEDDMVSWKMDVQVALEKDIKVPILFNLNGIADVKEAVSRGKTGAGATNWELYQISIHPEAAERIKFYLNDKEVENPLVNIRN